MQESVVRTQAGCLLAPQASASIGIVELRAACALLIPREAILGGNLVLKHKVRTWGVLSRVRFWIECKFEPLMHSIVQCRNAVRRYQREWVFHLDMLFLSLLDEQLGDAGEFFLRRRIDRFLARSWQLWYRVRLVFVHAAGGQNRITTGTLESLRSIDCNAARG